VKQTSILIAEDNVVLATLIAKSLRSEGYRTEMVHDGHTALKLAQDGSFDFLILDLDLPLVRGPEVLSRLRLLNKDIGVLILSGVNEIEERVARLDGGADDYITKPVALAELSARIRALMRRKGAAAGDAILRVADLELDRIQRKVIRNGKEIQLSGTEFKLLEYFMRNAGRNITRSMLMEEVWELSADTATNVVDVYVNYLRKKIDDDAPAKLINTVRGVGFRFGSDESKLGKGAGSQVES
jgi:DNA-binding response OmpR family regulator